MPASKFFRVAVEGATVDGRTIERKWISDIAETYAPATLTARVNCSHIVGYSPEPPFNAYGSVTAVKAEEFELEVGGQKVKRLALYAEIDANDQLVAVNKAGQKLFTSAEIHPDFAGTGKAYLVGLAITDTPASLGTEVLKFAALSRSNAFSPALDTTVEFVAEPADAAAIGNSIGRAILNFITGAGQAGQEGAKAAPEAKTPPAVQDAPQGGQGAANDNTFDPQAFASALAAPLAEQIAAASKPTNDAVAALTTRFDELETRLTTTDRGGQVERLAAAGGGSTSAILTDC